MRLKLYLKAACCLAGFAVTAFGGEVRLSAPKEFETDFSSPQAVALGGIDGDGKLDSAVVGNTISAPFACYKGTGDGSFGGVLADGDLQKYAVDLVLGDFDGNGALDIMALNTAGCG